MQPGGRKGFGRTVYLKIINTYGGNSAGPLFPVWGVLCRNSQSRACGNFVLCRTDLMMSGLFMRNVMLEF